MDDLVTLRRECEHLRALAEERHQAREALEAALERSEQKYTNLRRNAENEAQGLRERLQEWRSDALQHRLVRAVLQPNTAGNAEALRSAIQAARDAAANDAMCSLRIDERDALARATILDPSEAQQSEHVGSDRVLVSMLSDDWESLSRMVAEDLGKLVRETWIAWVEEQPSPKASWLAPWAEMQEQDREVDRRIGEAVAKHVAQLLYTLDVDGANGDKR